MVQLPSSEAGEDKKEFVESFLADKEITYKNKRLAVWLSEEKVNNENEFIANKPLDVKLFDICRIKKYPARMLICSPTAP